MSEFAPGSLPGTARRDGVDDLAAAHGPDRYPADRAGRSQRPRAWASGSRGRRSIASSSARSGGLDRTCELAGFGARAPSRAPICSSGTTASTRAGPRPRSARSGPGGTCSATAVPGASRWRPSAPGPTAWWLASKRPAAASSSSAMATSSASWPRAGWACRPRDARHFVLGTAALERPRLRAHPGRTGHPPLE